MARGNNLFNIDPNNGFIFSFLIFAPTKDPMRGILKEFLPACL